MEVDEELTTCASGGNWSCFCCQRGFAMAGEDIKLIEAFPGSPEALQIFFGSINIWSCPHFLFCGRSPSPPSKIRN